MIENQVIAKAIEYILLNIGEGVNLETLAKQCHMSVSYFSKLFKEQTGESVYAFIKRIKLEQSAMRLKMEQGKSITEIGEDYGYSASNYSAAFSQYHKKSPSEFRARWERQTENEEEIFHRINQQMRIEIKPEYTIMYERYIGAYGDMMDGWCKFMEKYRKDMNKKTILFERTFDDPTITDKNKCIYDICMSTETPEKYENSSILAGGKYAVYPYKGYISDIYPLNQQLVSIWFPWSHHEIDDRYSYDQYHRVDEDCYMEFDICFPIK